MFWVVGCIIEWIIVAFLLFQNYILFILFSIHLFLVWFCFTNPYLNAFTMLEISLIKQSLAQLYKT